MIAYIKGKIVFKSPTVVYLEAGQVAYQIQITLYTYGKIEKLDEVRLWIHLYMREDVQKLFGFFNEDERDVFVDLISVSGIGPNTGLLILSAMSSDEVRTAVVSEDERTFSRVKGIGPKTAKRTILDLKDKFAKQGVVASQIDRDHISDNMQKEASKALVSLGFQKNQISKALSKLQGEKMPVEELVREAIRLLSK